MTLILEDLDNSNRNGGAHALLWCDLETTGTNENVDDIIEIGALMTDFQFNQLGEPFSVVIDPSEYALGRMMKTPAVFKMHNENGLLEDILNQKGVDHDLAEADMVRWMGQCINKNTRKGPVEKFRFILAGSGVGHFDKKFIKTSLPKIDQLLAFPILDVGMVRRFLRFSGVKLAGADNSGDKDHRALGDIRLHLEEARAYRRVFQEAFAQ